MVIDGGGSKEFARLDLPGGGSTVWSWPEALPEPSVEGATATYVVADGVDLLVTATGSGVSTRIRISSEDAVVPEFTVQVRTDGVELDQNGRQLFFTDDGKRAGHTSTLTAWDARVDRFGDPLEVVAVDAGLEETASKGGVTSQDLTLDRQRHGDRSGRVGRQGRTTDQDSRRPPADAISVPNPERPRPALRTPTVPQTRPARPRRNSAAWTSSTQP